SWTVQVGDPQCGPVAGRVCALRNTREAIRIAHKSLRQKASKKGRQLQPQTLEFAKYVIVFTTFSEAEFSAAQVLDWYRMRWQVELVFALQIARAARASAQARRRQRQGLAR
ncbi:MAG: transposase, partial [Acidobacteriia bacterium]|nr:transposase [Terriglobia bacterium]